MGEALKINRKGGSSVKTGTAHAQGDALTIPDLIGAKNAIIGLCPNPSYPYISQSGELIVSVVIEDGVITSAYYNSENSVAKTEYLSFDPATGRISQPGTVVGDFAMYIDYKYVVY